MRTRDEMVDFPELLWQVTIRLNVVLVDLGVAENDLFYTKYCGHFNTHTYSISRSVLYR